MKWQKILFWVVTIFLFNETAGACEPILPFIKVVGGPAAIAPSWIVLLAVVAIKAVIFAVLQKRLSFIRASLLMFAGNVLTTFIGIIAAVLIGSGPIFVIGMLIVWPLCLMPARRFLAVVKRRRLKRFTPGSFSGVMVLALAASCFLFAVSSAFIDSNHLVMYWLWKLAAVYTALIVSILLTSFWEEWVIWKFSRCPADYTGFVSPVVRANLVVLFGVMLFAAGVALPQRLHSPNFLVPYSLKHQQGLEAKS
ncbi:MAG TPA: hypothetical protein VMA35_07750 [Candidatus Sulfopaludibacter sp.]|nr:hypothetical protein [Candidatus Sulfopaludibacter sp.]